MSGAASDDGKKEAQVEGGGLYAEDGQCDSGIGCSRSLHGQLGEGEPRSPSALRVPGERDPDPPCLGEEDTGAALETEERLDSSYGSSSLVESLRELGKTPEEEEEEAEEEEEEGLRQQLLETFPFVSEDGDTNFSHDFIQRRKAEKEGR
uniref:Uncharacterized protein n=1 Tax=Sphaerodactylus townsendi TaxID=933632 RepID=A0ACB8GBV7_9SAUR